MVKKRKAKGKSPKTQRLEEEVKEEMGRLGIEDTDKPDNAEAQMPIDPTRLPPRKLQCVFTSMVAWYAYANENLAVARINLLEVQSKLKRAKAEFRFTTAIKKKFEQDAAMEKDPKIRMLEKKAMRLEAVKIALEARVDNYDRKSKALSRDQTRREVEYGYQGRT